LEAKVTKVNRKLIRTTLAEVNKGRNDSAPPRERMNNVGSGGGGDRDSSHRSGGSHIPHRSGGGGGGGGSQSSGGGSSSGMSAAAQGRKRIPPAETNAEIFYYKKQMDVHTQMVIVLVDGEEIEGTIEWYDRAALKINRRSGPNVMLLKHNIKYMYKADDRDGDDNDDDNEGSETES
jgi:sRNA-binding regulator protein Hfq